MKNKSGYDCLARYYDRLTYDVDQGSMVRFILKTYEMHTGRKPGILLDLACGTGSFAIEAAREGIQVIGLDISPEMLARAMSKSREAGLDILFLQQDLCDFELYGSVDMITCCLDSINHILDPARLHKLSELVENYLEPGGLFIFDVNSKYKFEDIYSDNVFYEDFDDLTYIWQCRYDKETGIAGFDLTFFENAGGGMFAKKNCNIKEKYYSEGELDDIFCRGRLVTIGKFDGYSNQGVKDDSQRILHILKKRENLFK